MAEQIFESLTVNVLGNNAKVTFRPAYCYHQLSQTKLDCLALQKDSAQDVQLQALQYRGSFRKTLKALLLSVALIAIGLDLRHFLAESSSIRCEHY